ncbi:tonB-system energizer ExbB [uncultured Enterovirga sp.]|uniref:tonB-system energizer ExbB n=1 Tax=uncultured Enterovirga sp. TaxID=2026352 RepID=UPI0035CB4B20
MLSARLIRPAFFLLALCLATGARSQDVAAPAAPAVTAPAAAEPASGDPRSPAPTPARSIGASSGGEGGLHNLSPWAMFLGADLVVKGVMVGLAFASLVTWTIFLAKSLELLLAKRRVRAALDRLSRCRNLGDAEAAFPQRGRDVVASLVGEAGAEARQSEDLAPENGVRDRVASRCQEVIRAEGRSVRFGMGLLATIGSTSPFVGLFGTVWGIMNSFVGIAKAQTTNLAVVAPGIAEALLATAIGLVAAIPAVIIYNHFSRETRNYLELANRASGVVGRLLSRDLDRVRGGRLYPRAAAE